MRMTSKKTMRAVVILLAAVLAGHGTGGVVCAARPAKEGTKREERTDTHREYVVAQDGSGDFFSIQAAVDYAGDGDTIIISPGTYYENVVVWKKELSLIGTDRDKCTIAYDTTFYLCVPLEMAAGKVANLTIQGICNRTRDEGLLPEEETRLAARWGEEMGEENAMEFIEGRMPFFGYTVHADQHFSFGKELIFEKCRIISENGACFGIGSRGGEKVRFEECELLSQGLMPCIYLHDSPLPQLGGETCFALYNCSIQRDYMGSILCFDQILDCNSYVFDFQNVTADVPDQMFGDNPIQIRNLSGCEADGWCGMHNTMLATQSSGNTIEVMNWNINLLSDYEKQQLPSLF